ncbi:MAG: hypothetical protein ACH37Z_18475 [Anaerolineae bacterium]
MSGPDPLDHAPQLLAERLEVYLDEATTLAKSWFGQAAEDQPALIVQMATALLQREGSEVVALAINGKLKEQG